jgi:hypothetical protein
MENRDVSDITENPDQTDLTAALNSPQALTTITRPGGRALMAEAKISQLAKLLSAVMEYEDRRWKSTTPLLIGLVRARDESVIVQGSLS